jgi:hypothetical protein
MSIGAGEVAVVDYIGRTAKTVFERRVRVVDGQAVMDVNNALFKIQRAALVVVSASA